MLSGFRFGVRVCVPGQGVRVLVRHRGLGLEVRFMFGSGICILGLCQIHHLCLGSGQGVRVKGKGHGQSYLKVRVFVCYRIIVQVLFLFLVLE